MILIDKLHKNYFWSLGLLLIVGCDGFFGKISFNTNYKWVQGFRFEGSPQFTGIVPSYSLVDAQANYSIPEWNLLLKVGASNLLNNQVFQVYGGPVVGRMVYAQLIFDLEKK